jgi:hypothetical protein
MRDVIILKVGGTARRSYEQNTVAWNAPAADTQTNVS